MPNKIDYLIKDNQCEKAIDDFKTLTSVQGWLTQYSEFHDSVSIKPEGLPRITSSYSNGKSFENIQKFAHLFNAVNTLLE